jgi:hypothetical protein
MKKHFLGSLVVGLFILFQAAPASAEIKYIHNSSNDSGQPIGPNGVFNLLQGVLSPQSCWVFGPWVDHASSVTVSGSGVTAALVDKSGFINFRELIGTGRAKIDFIVSPTASPGIRTVTLDGNRGSFKVRILSNGRVTGMRFPPQTEFFRRVDITFTGVGLINPGIQYSFQGISGATAEVISSRSDGTEVVVRVSFPNDLAEASGEIKLFEKACGSNIAPCHKGSDGSWVFYAGLSDSQRTNVTITGPNAVRSITFPDGNSVTVGSVFTIQINLVRVAGTGGELVSWQLVPSNVFEEAQGSGTRFSPTGLNRIRIPTGDTLVRLQVRLRQIPNGCAQQCTAEVQTRMGNINTDQSPYFNSARFTIIAPKP